MIITAQEYNSFIGYEGTKVDPRVEKIIKAVSSVISNYLGYNVINSNGKADSIYTIKDRTIYYIDNLDSVDIKDIRYYRRSTDESIELYAHKNVFISGSRIELVVDWPIEDYDTIFVEYTVPEEVEEDIKLAALLLTRYYVKDEYVAQGISAAGSSITYITGKNLPPHVRSILDLHKIL